MARLLEELFALSVVLYIAVGQAWALCWYARRVFLGDNAATGSITDVFRRAREYYARLVCWPYFALRLVRRRRVP